MLDIGRARLALALVGRRWQREDTDGNVVQLELDVAGREHDAHLVDRRRLRVERDVARGGSGAHREARGIAIDGAIP